MHLHNRKAAKPITDVPINEVAAEIKKVVTDKEVHESLDIDEILNKIADTTDVDIINLLEIEYKNYKNKKI